MKSTNFVATYEIWNLFCNGKSRLIGVYYNMLFLAMACVVVIVMLTSCEKNDSTTEVPVDTITQSPVQKNLVSMLQSLGLMTVTLKSATLKTGDVAEMSFYDVYNDAKTSMKINEAESTKDAMVYYGVNTYCDDGSKSDLRYTLSENGSALSLKKEVMVNGKYAPLETFEFVKNPDGTVTQRQVMPDGTRVYIYTYKPDSVTSVTRFNEHDGYEDILEEINIVIK